jgi:Mg-chelatase subunit ChlD
LATTPKDHESNQMQTLNTPVSPFSAASKVSMTSARVKAAKAAAKPKKEKLDPVRIVFILDRSTSMEQMRDEAIEGFNLFVKAQQELPGKANFSFVLFDTEVVLVYDNANIKKIPALTRETFKPQGMTALYDAIGYTVERYKHAKKSEKTIVAILTDGQENASRKYNSYLVSQMLKEVQDEGKWEVLFLGANLDTAKFATGAGIKLSNSTSYDYTKKGLVDVIASASYATSAMRGATINVGGSMMDASTLNMASIYENVKSGGAQGTFVPQDIKVTLKDKQAAK